MPSSARRTAQSRPPAAHHWSIRLGRAGVKADGQRRPAPTYADAAPVKMAQSEAVFFSVLWMPKTPPLKNGTPNAPRAVDWRHHE